MSSSNSSDNLVKLSYVAGAVSAIATLVLFWGGYPIAGLMAAGAGIIGVLEGQRWVGRDE